jgi:hypothetical protein
MKKSRKATYLSQVKRWLESGKTITPAQAISEFGCTRLSAVIFRLKNEYDLPISTELISVKNRNGRRVDVARYCLLGDKA